MKAYRVKLELTGALTQLPDSQKVFGTLVYMLAEKYGGERATMLTRTLLNRKASIALSNVMPWGYLPTPQEYLTDRLAEDGGEQSGFKDKRAAIKKRNYITIGDVHSVLKNSESLEAVFPYVTLQHQQRLRISIESIRYGIAELDSKLYSVPAIELLEITKDATDKEQTKAVKTFCFYLQADGSGIVGDLLDMLDEATDARRTVILGKRASQGLNTFELCNMIEQDVGQAPAGFFLNTGMLLPDKIDFASSTLKLFTSERRPFEMVGGWDQKVIKHFISFIAEGSIISAPDGTTAAGKSIKSCFNENRDIVFGNAFLYPVAL
ncbi:MAG TPA: hypothetical protein VN381_07910 [Anaerovoracaceae bacterium]|nr:hypothetical protein [Anaerovoracaceae bacterium]